MDWFKVCSQYYNLGFYNNTSLKIFVAKGKITDIQYKEITEVNYVI